MLHYKTFLNSSSTSWVTFVHGAGGSSSIWFSQLRAFAPHFNLLLIDLRGHGQSKEHLQRAKLPSYTFNAISEEVVEVMNHLNIERSHFIGISLGTIIIREIAERHPERVQRLVLGGAILKLNFRSHLLIRAGVIFRWVVPYILLYKIFARVILPRRNHRESRLLFVREARKLYQKEFIRWFRLAAQLKPLLHQYRQRMTAHPTLYIMGSEDHMFLPSIRELTRHHPSRTSLQVIPCCGHVVNVEQPAIFNRQVLEFLRP